MLVFTSHEIDSFRLAFINRVASNSSLHVA
nr:MAG TPA: hypothetical protein [Caudoviricetes sp.]